MQVPWNIFPFKGEEEIGSEEKVETSIVPVPTAVKGTWKLLTETGRHSLLFIQKERANVDPREAK